MRTVNRSGLTLVEMLVGLVLLALLGAMAAVVARGAGMEAAAVWSALDRTRTIAVAAALLHEDLRDASVADVAVPVPASLEIGAPVGDAPVCGLAASELFLVAGAWTGARAVEAGRDVARVLADPVGEVWDTAAVTAVADDRCPDGSGAAVRLTLAHAPDGAAAVEVFEPVRIAAYHAGAADWFGLAPAGPSSLQPFAGPIATGTAGFGIRGGQLLAEFTPQSGSDTVLTIPLGGP